MAISKDKEKDLYDMKDIIAANPLNYYYSRRFMHCLFYKTPPKELWFLITFCRYNDQMQDKWWGE